MERKLISVLIAIIAITGLGLIVVPDKAEASDFATGFVPREPKEVLISNDESASSKQIYPFYDDYPDVIAFKGIAEKDEEVYPAFFVGIEYEGGKFNHNFLIIDGDVIELEFQDIKIFSDKQIGIITFSSQKGELKFIVKEYKINWHKTMIASVSFDGYLINMRILEPQEPLFRIMENVHQTSVSVSEHQQKGKIVKDIIEKIKK